MSGFTSRAAATLVAGVLLFSFEAAAQTYPNKIVRVVIPWPAGGSNDIVGRVVMQRLSTELGQQFMIDNRPGASGSIGANVVAKAPADGYTLMVHSTTHVANGTFYKNLPYDTLKDFIGVAQLCSQPGALVVHPSLPVKSVKEFVALARAKPGQILYASSGNGSGPHLWMAQLIEMTGIDIVHVPYKGGPPGVNALLSGEAPAMLASIATVLEHVKAGKLRMLAVAGGERMKMFPDMPTISEAGVPGYEVSAWVGVFGPAGIPRDIVSRLNSEINQILKLPDVQRVLSAQVLEPWPATPDEFAARLKADYEKYSRLIKLTGAQSG